MKKVILLLVSILLISLAYSFAAVPCKINYQGRLIKDNVPVNVPVNMEFKLYTQPTGGTLIKTISISNVPVYNGLFRVVLDLEGVDWTAGQTIYLEVKAGTDILSPREPIYAYPYAINSRFLEGKAKDYFINTSADTQRKDGGLNIMGNVGIGTASPARKLDVAGNARIVGGSADPALHVSGNTGIVGAAAANIGVLGLGPGSGGYTTQKTGIFGVQLSKSDFAGYFEGKVSVTGNVGIGTTSPTAKLHIGGTAGTDGIRFPDGTLQTTAVSNTIVQIVEYQTGAVATTSTTIPYDDTIPQNTEGGQFMSVAITPRSATNRLKIDVVFHGCPYPDGIVLMVALFQDALPNALAVGLQQVYAFVPVNIKFTHFMTAGTTNQIVFKVRAGPSSGRLTFNGHDWGQPKMGGRLTSSITVTEIK